MNSASYFDLCAIILYVGLYLSITTRHIAIGRANRVLQMELVVGGVASIFSFIISFMTYYCPPVTASIHVMVFCKYMQLILQLLLINLNTLYFYIYLGIQEYAYRHKVYFVFCLVLLIVPFIAILLNIPFGYLFFVTPTLNVGTSPYYLVLYLLYISVFIKDAIFLICCNKYILNKGYFFSIFLLFINAFFLVFQSILPEWKQFLFVFAISMYIQVSYMQRPDLMINPLFNAMSRQAFIVSATKILRTKNQVVIALIKISNYKNLKLYVGQQSYLECVKSICKEMKNLLDMHKLDGDIYYLEHGVYSVIINSKMTDKVNRVLNEINYHLHQEMEINNFNVLYDANMCVVNLPEEINTIEYLAEFTKIFDHIIPKKEEIVYFSDISMTKEFQIKNKLKEIVERAIAQGNFVVYYQPIYGVKEERYISAEALVRINDPEFGLIMPNEFISYAEQNDYIRYIGDFVFESVCKFISSPEFKNSGLKFVEMNLSTAQCLEENFVNKISGIMQRYKVTTEEIRFEITEETADLHPAIVEQSIKSIHDMGIVFALDGYGTGYSNIKKFNSLPFDIVKLDKSFVVKSKDKQIKLIIEDTIRMFKKLGKQVLIEGIESKEMEEDFKNMEFDFVQGCEYLQGYLYSKPMPQEEFIRFINLAQ